MITRKRLIELLHYEKDSGCFFWKKSRYGTHVGKQAGGKAQNGYIRIRVDGDLYLAHRLAWFYVYGYWSENEIDHKNKNRSDNRLSNLREVSHQCNIRNQSVKKNNNSGISGVYLTKKTGKWRADIMHDKKRIGLGSFDTKLEAAIARYEAEKEYGYLKCETDSSAYRYIKKY